MATLNEFLTSIADAIRNKKGTSDKINAQNFASEISSIEGGGSSGGATLKSGLLSTAVPVDNTTYIENIYLNTQLSNEEIVNLLENNISLSPTYGAEAPTGFIFTPTTSGLSIVVIAMNGIAAIVDMITGYFYFAYDTTGAGEDIAMAGFSGWNTDFNGVIVINDTQNSATITYLSATLNENLKSLISITPFEKLDMELSGVYAAKNINETLNITENGTTTLSYASDFETNKEILYKVNVNVNVNVKDLVSGLQWKLNTSTGSGKVASYLFAYMYQSFDDETLNNVLSKMDFSGVKKFSYMFCGSYGIKNITANIDTSYGEDFSYMFTGCWYLKSIPPLNTNLATDMNYMFESCNELSVVDITTLSDKNENIFKGCYALKTFVIRNVYSSIPKMVISGVYDMFNMSCYHFKGTQSSTYNPDGLKDGKIYVPDDYVDSFKTADGWKLYADCIYPLSEYVEE